MNINPIELMRKITKTIITNNFPGNILLDGKNCWLGPEGSSKSTQLMNLSINTIRETKGKCLFFLNNTIEETEESNKKLNKINELKEGPVNLGSIFNCRSTSEITRLAFANKSPRFFKSLKKKRTGREQLHIQTCFKYKTHRLKQVQTYDGDYNYEYNNDDGDLQRSFRQINWKFSKDGWKKTTYDMIIIISHDGSEVNFTELDKEFEFIEQLTINGHGKQFFKCAVQRRKHIESILNKNQEVVFFSQIDLKKIGKEIRNTKDTLNNIILNHNKNSNSIVINVQHEKMDSILKSIEKLPEERQKYIYDNFIFIVDELPINKNTTFTLDKLGEYAKALVTPPSERNDTEYQLMKNVSKDIQEKYLNEINSVNDPIKSLPIVVDMFHNDMDAFITPVPIFRSYGSSRVSPLLDKLNNVVILTTERLGTAFIHKYGFKIYEYYHNDNSYIYDNITITAVNNQKYDTTKKNKSIIKNIVNTLRSDDCFQIGNSILGCDSTIEAIKGSNKLYENPDLKTLIIYLSPPHPNKTADTYMEYKDVDNKKNLFNTFAIQDRIDDINQMVGRVAGPRSKYRKVLKKNFEDKVKFKYSGASSQYIKKDMWDDINIHIIYSNCDNITREALNHTRYLKKGFETNYI